MSKKEILALNSISAVANAELAPRGYVLVKESAAPAAILLRSFDMHGYTLPDSVLCVGRAGAGVNNIPHAEYAQKGVVVFNTPGANANAVKELVLCAMLLCGRDVTGGIAWAQSLTGNADVAKAVESGKKAFAGTEIAGKTLGVVGLGAIGARVANAAVQLGMRVIGYDPYISIDAAWHLNQNVQKETDLNRLLAVSDYVTLHIPCLPSTKGLICAETIAKCKHGMNLINCARGELCVNADVIAAVRSGKIHRYVTDFPQSDLLGVQNIVTIPHLGASTDEAEDNCAVGAARQIVDFLENGNITNAVNFPACHSDRSGVQRITVIHKNVKNVISSVSDLIGKQGVNISSFNSQASGETSYAILDLDDRLTQETRQKIESLDTVIRLRVLE